MKKEKQSEYVTLLVLDFALVLVYLKFPHNALLYSALGLSFFGVVIPFFRHFISLVFGWITGFIGKIVSALILGLFFYGFLTPIALLKKLTGKTAVPYKRNMRSDSYFTPTSKIHNHEDFEKLW